MNKHQKEAILISFFNAKKKYKKLAEYVVDLIKDDPSSPQESLHTVIYRIKDEFRLIEKIDSYNRKLASGADPITAKNYQLIIGDLLGVRIICLRLSDIGKVATYLGLLAEEKILKFMKGPDQKRSFILPLDPGDSIPAQADLTYSGYSSIHYLAKLGPNLDAPSELKGIQFEFQLRTILEEAWGEIDHKYRYTRSRIDDAFPEYIHSGFYNFSAYLQVAALQAEYLCRLADAYYRNKIAKTRGRLSKARSASPGLIDTAENKANRKHPAATLMKFLETVFGFKVTVRTLIYFEKRLDQAGFTEKSQKAFKQLFAKERMDQFKSIFRQIFDHRPFANEKEKNLDAINALNFVIFYELQGVKIAQEGLKSVLRWRKERSKC
jgi:ppGpp synthetase/RelA/SpoT-type nucleotidyltranferase